jgi:hypothetical protein
MTHNEFLKYAYQRGLEAGMDKVSGPLLSRAGKWISKAYGAPTRAAKATATAAPEVARAAPKTWLGRAGQSVERAWDTATGAAGTHGRNISGNLGSLAGFGGAQGTIGSKLYSPFRLLGGFKSTDPAREAFRRNLAGEVGGFGMIGGALGAASAEEGDRLSGFGKGFGLGALGGLGWGYGSAGTRKGLGALAKKRLAKKPGSAFWKTTAESTRAPKYDFATRTIVNPESAAKSHGILDFGEGWGRRLREAGAGLGAKAAVGAGGLGTGILGAHFAERAGEKYIPGLADTPARAAVTGMGGVRAARGMLRATPQAGAMRRVAGGNYQ